LRLLLTKFAIATFNPIVDNKQTMHLALNIILSVVMAATVACFVGSWFYSFLALQNTRSGVTTPWGSRFFLLPKSSFTEKGWQFQTKSQHCLAGLGVFIAGFLCIKWMV
jgi:hypothetical protein